MIPAAIGWLAACWHACCAFVWEALIDMARAEIAVWLPGFPFDGGDDARG